MVTVLAVIPSLEMSWLTGKKYQLLQYVLQTFLYTWFMPALSTAMCLVILRFYLLDVKRAKQIDLRDEEESATLMGDKSHLFDDW